MKTFIKNELKRKPAWSLLILYAIIVAIRFALATATSAYPIVSIDEFLYYSVARSIATEGRILFRGQPADYSYIFYPLCLAPVYILFTEGANFYRIIQLWNIILMSFTLFPAFGLYHALLKDRKKAFIGVLITMFLPDFILGQMIFSEAVIYPLFFTVLYCAYRYITDKKYYFLLLIGVLGALLYYAKPGAALPSAVFLLIFFVEAIRKKNVSRLTYCVGGIFFFLAMFGIFQILIKNIFGYTGNFLSIYEIQVGNDYGWHWDIFFKAIPAYLFYLILSCGIIGAVYPFMCYKNWSKEHRQFAFAVLVSLLLMIIGTAWTINRHEYASEIIHLRYIAMYIPLTAVFSFLPQNSKKNDSRGNKLFISAFMLFMMVYAIVKGVGMNVGNNTCYPFLSLSILLQSGNMTQELQPVCIAAVILCCAFVLYYVWGKRQKNNYLPSVAAGVMIILMFANTIHDYLQMSKKTDFTAVEQVAEIRSALKEDEYIFVYTDERVADYGLDINNRKNINQITLNDLFNHVYSQDGCLVPFIPEKTRGTLPSELIPDTDIVVFDKTVYPLIQFSDSVSVEQFGESFAVAQIKKGMPIADSIIANVKAFELAKSATGILVIYNTELTKQPLKMRFHLKSRIEQTMTIFSSLETHTIPLDAGQQWYEVVFEHPETAYNFMVDQTSVNLYQYELLPQK